MIEILQGKAVTMLRTLPAGSVHVCVTSPPYWGLRAYLPADHPDKSAELGLENVHDCLGWATGQPCGVCYVCHLVKVFREVRRVLRDDGTCWLVLGDSYAGGGNGGFGNGNGRAGFVDANKNIGKPDRKNHTSLKPKDLCMIPARVALALQADGWWVRSKIVWAKKAPMPESVTDRPTRSHEVIWLLSKSARYFYDAVAVAEPHSRKWFKETVGPAYMTSQDGRNDGGKRQGNGNPSDRNQRDVWTLGPDPYPEAHFATFPREIPRRAILAGTSARGCCPACGAGWVRVVERGNAQVLSPKSEYGNGAGRNDGNRSMLVNASSTTLGWSPSCTCPAADPIPATVLDPFLGSGTTAAVAVELGRDAIGIELNAEYIELARRRLDAAQAPLASTLI